MSRSLIRPRRSYRSRSQRRFHRRSIPSNVHRSRGKSQRRLNSHRRSSRQFRYSSHTADSCRRNVPRLLHSHGRYRSRCKAHHQRSWSTFRHTLRRSHQHSWSIPDCNPHRYIPHIIYRCCSCHRNHRHRRYIHGRYRIRYKAHRKHSWNIFHRSSHR